jgi:hypothetical protein
VLGGGVAEDQVVPMGWLEQLAEFACDTICALPVCATSAGMLRSALLLYSAGRCTLHHHASLSHGVGATIYHLQAKAADAGR